MVHTCCVKSCRERRSRDTNISFHRFPKDPELKEKWRKAINYENVELSANSTVCSKHFGSDCFVGTSSTSRRHLLYGAIPRVSEVPEVPYMQTIEAVNVPLITIEDENASLNNEFANNNHSLESAADKDESPIQEMPLKKMRKSYIGDFLNPDVTIDQETLKHLFSKTLDNKNKQIRQLQRTNRTLLKKVEDLHQLLEELRVNNMINEDSCVMLLDKLPAFTKDLFKQLLQNNYSSYPAELKTFALILNFYSPRAYDYVRNAFSGILPHSRTLQKWYALVLG